MHLIIRKPGQIGGVIRARRREQNLTQVMLGEKVALAQNALSDMEHRSESASLARVFRVLHALDLELIVRPKQPRSGSDS